MTAPSPTEWLFTGPFRIATATPCQLAACRILDGAPLGDLARDPDVQAFVGGAEALATLPTTAPQELLFLASIRSAKTIMACAAAYRMARTVDVSGLGPGEIPRVSIVSLKLDVSAVAFGILRDTILATPTLRETLLGDPLADSLVIRHPSGRPVEIKCVAGAKAGAGLVARWSAGAIFDEAPRMAGRDEAVVNLADSRTALIGRLLPGAQVLYIGSAWAPFGPIYDWVQERWRKPTADMVVLRGTGPMLNPIRWTPERCAKLQAQDPVAYMTDVLGEFADPEEGLLSPLAVRRATRGEPLELSPEPGACYSAAVDPSEGGAGGNGWTLVVTQVVNAVNENAIRQSFRVALAREWRGVPPDQCWAEIAAECARYGLRQATSDQYAAAANVALAARYGLHLEIRRTTAQSKLEDFTNLATLIGLDALELPPNPTLAADLMSVRRRTTQTGASIVLPRTSDGRHCDFAPALAASLQAGATFHTTTPLIEAMRERIRRREQADQSGATPQEQTHHVTERHIRWQQPKGTP